MASEAYVHVWLPGSVEPVLCGRLLELRGEVRFGYSRAYLEREDRIPLDPRALRLGRGIRRPPRGKIHGVLRDASPDAWGRRILETRRGGGPLGEIDYLLGAGHDRIGALTVTPGTELGPVADEAVDLATLLDAARRIEAGEPLPESLDLALLHGTSVGGVRPKALLDSGDRKWIAKFASSTDRFPIVRSEYAAMQLAGTCGLSVPRTELVESLGKDVLVVERFDRTRTPEGWTRRLLASALTVLDLEESEARLASYLDLAGFLRKLGRSSPAEGRELFRRMVYSILIGNTDDHARNHAFFWDGRAFEPTPAYDLCPMLRSGRTAAQAMIVGREGRRSTLANARSEAPQFGLEPAEARDAIDELVESVRLEWPKAADRAGLTSAQRSQLERETVLGPGCFE